MFSEAEPRGASRVEGKLGSTFTSDQFFGDLRIIFHI